jgi:hypothetical protein
MMTGTQTSGAKGLASPPVMKSSAVSWQRSKASSRKAESGVSRCAGGKTHRQKKIHRCQERDQHGGRQQRQRKFQPQPDDDDRDRLAGDRQPAQPDDRLEAQATAGALEVDILIECHPAVLSALGFVFAALSDAEAMPLRLEMLYHVPRGLTRVVGMASAGSSGQGCLG